MGEETAVTSEMTTAVDEVDLRSLLGPGHEVVSVRKEVKVKTSEVLLVNGTPISLEDDEEGDEIKACLLSGRMPNQDLINHLLMRAGLILSPKRQVVTSEVKVTKVDMGSEASVVTASNGEVVATAVNMREEVIRDM